MGDGCIISGDHNMLSLSAGEREREERETEREREGERGAGGQSCVTRPDSTGHTEQRRVTQFLMTAAPSELQAVRPETSLSWC